MSNNIRLLSKSEKDFVRDCVSVVCSVVRLYGFEMNGYSLKKTMDHWIYCCMLSEKHPMAFIKYKLSSFYASYKSEYNFDEFEVTPWDLVDKRNVLLGGKVMRFLAKLERTSPHSFESFCTTILYTKKGMPRPDKKMLRLAEADAFAKLTVKSPPKPLVQLRSWYEESVSKISGTITKERMELEIVRTARDIYLNKTYSDLDRVETLTPTTSADYINNRKKGGVIGMLFDQHKDLLDGLRTKEELIQLGGITVGRPERSMENNNVVTIRSSEKCLQTVDFSRLDGRFSQFYNRLVRKALVEIPLAQPLALAEALKTRVISKGPALLYTCLKPLQKFMWKHMSALPTFKLTGTPVTGEILQDIIGANLKEGERFLSVDYSDATNEIEGWASNCAMNAIADLIKLSVEEREMAIRSLTGHIMSLKIGEYPNFTEKQAPQAKGQLMGGILSFPILCIVNATILRLTKEIADNRTYTLRDCGCAVNGDDGVIKTNLYGRDVWKSIGSFCGLKPSVGKVYFSKQFLNINSTTYNFYSGGWTSRRIERANGTFSVRTCNYEHVKYVNMGLLLGLTRSGGGVDSTDISRDGMTFGARATELVNSSPVDMQERILGQFLHLNKEKIKIDLPYFIPENMGGLGLPAVGKYSSSKADLMFARLIHENPQKYKMPRKPLDTAWKFWEYATKRFPFKNSYVNTDIECLSNISLATIRSKACVEALFRLSDIKELLDEINDDDAMAIYQKSCRRVWTQARRVTNPPEPYTQGKFPQIYNNDDRKLFHIIGY